VGDKYRLELAKQGIMSKIYLNDEMLEDVTAVKVETTAMGWTQITITRDADVDIVFNGEED
jgi:hypothetical protein